MQTRPAAGRSLGTDTVRAGWLASHMALAKAHTGEGTQTASASSVCAALLLLLLLSLAVVHGHGDVCRFRLHRSTLELGRSRGLPGPVGVCCSRLARARERVSATRPNQHQPARQPANQPASQPASQPGQLCSPPSASAVARSS
ncbi:hypothetical protein PMIN06_004664 [Paraphaeosphaeria minitans]